MRITSYFIKERKNEIYEERVFMNYINSKRKRNKKNKNFVNWNILVAKGKEINRDFISSGERK